MPDSRPLTSLLLGWGNATASQLAAYERLHASLGLAPCAVLPSTSKGLFDPRAYREAIAPLADDLVAGRTRVDLVHLFSDNGFIAWAALLDRLDRGGEGGARARDAIRGVVYDSSPGLWASTGKRDFARRFAGAMTPLVARALGRDVNEAMPRVGAALEGAFLVYQVVRPSAVRMMMGASEHVARAQPRVPHLFLYARNDALVPVRDVEAWIRLERTRGIPVTARCFGRARHVALYPDDPRRYKRELAAFVEHVRDG